MALPCKNIPITLPAWKFTIVNDNHVHHASTLATYAAFNSGASSKIVLKTAGDGAITTPLHPYDTVTGTTGWGACNVKYMCDSATEGA